MKPIKTCCSLLPRVEERTGESGRKFYAMYCAKCDRTTWYYHDLDEAIIAWNQNEDSISALTHSEMLLIGKGNGKKWLGSVALVLIWLGLVYYLGTFVNWG